MKKDLKNYKTNKQPPVFNASNNFCVWSKAGVIEPVECINSFDCLSCLLNKRLKNEVAMGRLKDGRVPADRKLFTIPVVQKAEQMKCRHMLSGRVSYKYCVRNYECETCEYNQMMEDEILAETKNDCQKIIAGGFALAKNYYYHTGHSWARVEYGGFVRVGIDDFSARLFGPFDRIDLPELGSGVFQDKPFCSFSRGGLQAESLCPAEGVVVAINPAMRNKGKYIMDSPYDQDWLMVIEPIKKSRSLRKLMFAEKSRLWLENEAFELTAIIEEDSGCKLAATGGQAISDIYGKIPGLDWKELKNRFLHT
jgi:glycine cleavage system H lipoate-binding protein